MDLDNETKEKIQELQSYEQNLQNLLMQKQTFQIELSESENALSEISKSDEDVYKIVGQVMIKVKKDIIIKELNQKIDLLNLRLKSIEKQESELTKDFEELRKEVLKKINK
ncbi:MAG: prefoldin subunit beta [Candidatus Pacearchaeota archaeon]|jgi:prefoldin beta subunit